MEVLHKIISSHQIGSIPKFVNFFEMIIVGKNVNEYHPIMECFSEEIWKVFSEDWVGYDDEGGGNYKFSPGKMYKNFIKLYWFEMPLDYVILEVDDVEYEKLRIMKIV